MSTESTSRPEAAAGSALTQQWADGLSTVQRELLSASEQASRAWAERAQSEAALWLDFMAKLSGAKSAPEFLEVYSKCLSHRMQMALDDSRRIVEEYQGAVSKIANAMSNGAKPMKMS